ncbi:NAD(P)/FAD-dependent oxidoreductase [Lysobacter tyrosinilyticus]
MGVGQNETALVIGGGIVGLACALQLQRLGLRTVLVEAQAQPAAASYGNAGHIAVEQVEPLASWATIRSAPRRLFARGGALDVRNPVALTPWLLRFARASTPARFDAGRIALSGLLQAALPAWRELVDVLGRRDLLQVDGHTVLWESAQSAQHKRDAWMRADIGSARVRDLEAAELDEFATLLRARPVGGIRFDGTGQVADPALVLQALREAFSAAGGEYVHGHVRALAVEAGRAVAVRDDGSEPIRADLVLVTAGIGAKPLMASLGINAPVVAERGYHLQWAQHGWPARFAPVVFEDRSLIVTRFRSGLRAASFVEFARPQTPPDPRKWDALMAHATALRLPVHEAPQAWMGARPTLPDYLPAIGRSHAIPNLCYAFGHQHLGLTLAPITARLVAALAVHAEPPLSIAAFDLKRFQ